MSSELQGWKMKIFYVNQVFIYSMAHSFIFLYKERKFPKFVSKEMETCTLRSWSHPSTCSWLIWRACQCPKAASSSFRNSKRKPQCFHHWHGWGSENQLSKSGVVLSFSLEVKSLNPWELLAEQARLGWLDASQSAYSPFAPQEQLLK